MTSYDNVKDSIDYYTSKCEDIRYLLIVGNSSQVPPRYIAGKGTYNPDTDRYFYPYHGTDLYYGLKNSEYVQTQVPDLYRGRIPASTDAEARLAFEKIAAYEYYKINTDPEFFSHALHSALFQDTASGTDGYDDVRFIRTSEEILESVKKLGVDPIRNYGRTFIDSCKQIMPRYYRKSIYEKDEKLLPDDLLDANFDWNGNSTKFRDALSKGVFYVLHRGHGIVDHYSTPRYSIKDVGIEDFAPSPPNLTIDIPIRQTPRPVYFNIACQTGNFLSDSCLATSQLLKSYGGASCVIAATENSINRQNDILALSIFESFLPDTISTNYLKDRFSNSASDPIFRIGKIMDWSLYRMTVNCSGHTNNKYQREVYHIFGDPSMMIRTEKPTIFKDASINLDKATNICHVKLEEAAYISFYDKYSDEIKCFYAPEAEFKFSNIKYGYDNSHSLVKSQNVMIYAPNKIPILHNSWYHDGEQLDGSKKSSVVLSEKSLLVATECRIGDEVIIYITDALTGTDVLKYVCDPTLSKQKVDISKIPSGVYVAVLMVNGVIESSLTFFI